MNSTNQNPDQSPPEEMDTTPDGNSVGETPSELTLLRQELDAAVAERDANYEKWLRSQAELDNLRKRVQKEMSEARQYQSLSLARDLLPTLDNLYRAIAAAEQAGEVGGQLIEGIKMVVTQMEEVLARHSVRPIESIHQPFDPNLHEAVQQIASPDHDPMTVLQELQRGYTMHDRVIRPAQVIVSSTPPE